MAQARFLKEDGLGRWTVWVGGSQRITRVGWEQCYPGSWRLRLALFHPLLPSAPAGCAGGGLTNSACWQFSPERAPPLAFILKQDNSVPPYIYPWCFSSCCPFSGANGECLWVSQLVCAQGLLSRHLNLQQAFVSCRLSPWWFSQPGAVKTLLPGTGLGPLLLSGDLSSPDIPLTPSCHMWVWDHPSYQSFYLYL